VDSLTIAAPEIFLLTATCIVLVVSLFTRAGSNTVYWLSQATLIVTLLFAWGQTNAEPVVAYVGAYGIDGMSSTLKVWLLIVGIGVLLYSRDYVSARRIQRGEYFVLALFAIAGMMIMVSAKHLLTVYLGLELLALSQYAMVALARDDGEASEAAMKYFVLGALASGMLLYGMSMVYGATGSLELDAIREAVVVGGADGSVPARFGLTFLIVGIAFKLGAVPFHMWVPDVYEGAPISVAMFIATAPKIAAFAMLIRLLVDALPALNTDWQAMLAILAALSMIVGNLVAIAQTNIKRMLAYSTISNVGFLLMGIVGASPAGYSAAMFYAITYSFTTLAAFGVLIAMSHGKREDGSPFEAVRLDDLAGLAKRNGLLAGVMLLAMISLAGVPPMVGFYAKLAVLRAAVDAGFLWLALVGVAMSVVGAFYYLRIIKLMFFDEPVVTTEVTPASDVSAGLAVNGLAVILLGIFPSVIMAACLAAFA
jgi:NADH-quinone oxidoreductase subunit N